MSTVETLKVEVEDAQKAAYAATAALTAARVRLQEAINQESGIVGHALEFKQSRGYGKKATTSVRRILVDRVGSRWNTEGVAFGRIILKDGSIGVMRSDVEIDKATDLGPYERKAAE